MTMEGGEKFRKTATTSRMTNSISDQLKKPRADPKGSNQKKEPKPTKHGGDEAIKGERT